MKSLLFLLEKEFTQIFRDKTMLKMMVGVPIFQLIILVNAATFDLKNTNLAIMDFDMSKSSQELVKRFSDSPFFTPVLSTNSEQKAYTSIEKGKADAILTIPRDFERDIAVKHKASVMVEINAINASAAGLINSYSNTIITNFNRDHLMPGQKVTMPIKADIAYWYNPQLNYKLFMLPGILVILVTIMGSFMAAINMVKEKELGTIEQLNVTPLKKSSFIVSKLLPFWVIAIIELSFGLLIGFVLFNLQVKGSFFVLYSFTAIYLIAVLGLGLLIAALSDTQQQVMFVSFFFLLIFILMSGIFTSVESMPHWAQEVNVINPIAYFMRVIRMVILKGSGFYEIRHELLAMTIFAIVSLTISIKAFRKTVS
ncbi:MAG TPA: ABC transporter permease [Williamwhitmania sp.]|nr:ABC transporter permease [Williamwhitmania sp.]